MTRAQGSTEASAPEEDLLRPPWYARRLVFEEEPQAEVWSASTMLVLDSASGELPDDGEAPELVVDLGPLTLISPVEQLTRVHRLACAMEARGWAPKRVVVGTRAGGAAAGAWKAVAREWVDEGLGETTARVVHVGANATVDQVRDAVLAEAKREGPLDVRLASAADGLRTSPVLRAVALGETRVDGDSVVLMIGGARGIVARIALELASRTGCRLAVLGRTAASDSPRGIGAPFDRRAARGEAKAELGLEAAAKDLTALVKRWGREHEVATNLAGLRAAGASDVRYVQGDASDPESLMAVLAQVRERFGRLDMIVHGAGVDRSRRLTAKSEDELAWVMAPKVGAVDALLADGAFVVGLGSVSARFGNAGQIDYAAANEALATRVVDAGGLMLDYTAWADVGMAAPLAKAMRSRGVDPLGADDAAKATADLIVGGATGEWVLSGRLPQTKPQYGPALGGEDVLNVPGATLVRQAELELAPTAWLLDHRSTAAGLMPGVVALAAMTAAGRSLAPWLQLRSVRDVAFEAPLKVFRQRSTVVDVRAERGVVTDGALRIPCRVEVGDKLHHRSELVLGGPAMPETGASEKLPTFGPGPSADRVYRTFFHGPSFQVLDTSELADGVVRATSKPLDASLGRDIPEPYRRLAMARELAFQAPGVYMMTRLRKVALPVGAQAIHVFDEPRDGERVTALAFHRATEPLFKFDVELRGEDGRLLERFERLAFRYLATL